LLGHSSVLLLLGFPYREPSLVVSLPPNENYALAWEGYSPGIHKNVKKTASAAEKMGAFFLFALDKQQVAVEFRREKCVS
jgi:hypothetical protein